MDTATHIIAGTTIGVIASESLNNEVQWPIFFVCIISSLLPDIDVLFKFINNDKYVLNHRGLSHSILTLPILALIPALIMIFFSQDFFQLYLLSFISIFFHLIMDTLNPYGTSLIPTKKDIRFDIIYTFDPIFFAILTSSLIAIFYTQILYIQISLLILYLLIRTIIRICIKKKLHKQYQTCNNVQVIAKANPFVWHIIITFNDEYLVGSYKTKLYDIDKFKKNTEIDISILKYNETFKAFAKKSYAYIIRKTDNQITLIDLKYRKKGYYYFRSIYRLEDNEITNSYLGWVFSDENFTKKLDKRTKHM